jgi:5-methylcytosine-specific restriction enzyme A
MPACTVHVVAGPPGPHLRRHAQHNCQPGARIIDIAEIIERLSQGKPGNWFPVALEERNQTLANLAKAPADEEVWLIQLSPRQWQRDWWATHLNARVHLIDPGKPAALAEAAAAGVNVRFVHAWYDEFADPNGQTTPPVRDTRERHLTGAPAGQTPANSAAKYGTKQGQMRTAQLARQPWCERCEAEGRGRVVATDMNHIVPFMQPDGKPDYKLFGDPKNHESLCRTCHQAHGARTDRDASPLGSGSDGRPLDPNHPWNQKGTP